MEGNLMPENNLTPETSSGVGRKYLNLGIYLLVVILISAGIYYALSKYQPSETIQEALVTLNDLSPSEQLEIIKASSSFLFSNIATQEVVEFSSLPEYIQGLFANMNGEFQSIFLLTFEDGTTGYSINFSSSSNTAEELYFLFQRNSQTPWPPVTGSRTNDAAFLNIDHEEYFVVADFLKMGSGVDVSVTLLVK